MVIDDYFHEVFFWSIILYDSMCKERMYFYSSNGNEENRIPHRETGMTCTERMF